LAKGLPSGDGVSADERTTIVACLELAGLILIAWGYADLRTEFGRPSIREAAKSYLKEFLSALRSPRVVHIKATGAGTISVSGSGTIVHEPRPISPLERRVEILEG